MEFRLETHDIISATNNIVMPYNIANKPSLSRVPVKQFLSYTNRDSVTCRSNKGRHRQSPVSSTSLIQIHINQETAESQVHGVHPLAIMCFSETQNTNRENN